MDVVAKQRIREFTLLMLVSGMALIANLPEHVLLLVNLDHGVVIAAMSLVVLLTLFLYVRMFFFLLYSLLAIGANLPEQWASTLNVTQGPLLAALIAMVSIALVNYVAKALPTGLDQRKKRANPEALQALLKAIDRESAAHVRALLSLDFDIDCTGADGLTPLMLAVHLGNAEIVTLLLQSGANEHLKGPQGSLAEIAADAGHHELAAFITARASALPPAALTQNAIG